MHKVVLGPNGSELNSRLPTHVAIRAVVERSLRLVTPCSCANPWSVIEVEDTWQDGKLRFSSVEACCLMRISRICEALPGCRKIPRETSEATPRSLLVKQ